MPEQIRIDMGPVVDAIHRLSRQVEELNRNILLTNSAIAAMEGTLVAQISDLKKTIVDVICGKTPTQHLNNGVNIYSSPEVHYLMKAAAWETAACATQDRVWTGAPGTPFPPRHHSLSRTRSFWRVCGQASSWKPRSSEASSSRRDARAASPIE